MRKTKEDKKEAWEFHFSSPRMHYAAEACIIWCFDNRFRSLLHTFITARRFTRVDCVVVAGGAKSLASSERKTDCAYLLRQIKKSIALHKAELIILMTHSDCGAYGGLEAFGGDARCELEQHIEDLRDAVGVVKNNIPGSVEIETIFADFQGIRSI